MGDGQSVEALQWLAYIGRTRNNVTHVVNGKGVRLSRVQNEKVEVYCAERKISLRLPWVFWHGCPTCIPNRGKPIGNTTETYDRRYEETMARLQKIRYAGYNVVSIWG